MAYYDKKVIYLSEMEYGNRIKGAGFVKMECRGESCSFDVHISGMRGLPEKKYDIVVVSVQGKEYTIGKIFLYGGNGEWKEIYGNGRVTATGEKEGENNGENGYFGGNISYREIVEIMVRISDTKRLAGKMPFQPKVMQAAEMAVDVMENKIGKNTDEKKNEGGGAWRFVRGGKGQMKEVEKEDRQENVGGEIERKREEKKREIDEERVQREAGRGWKRESVLEADIRSMGKERKREDTCLNNEKGSSENIVGENRKGPIKEEQKMQVDDVILNDKWDQLKQIYSVIHPYEDDRQYIAIQPKDFVIMTGDYQHLANNSFLLHGFYNYRHIVLGRERDGNFYLGVPGVYYEREKMVALMFGFEAFECDGGRAEAGKFGYYLRRVKI